MARTSPVHYIEPSAISITPNANNSHRDLAVYVTKDAKIKVLCPRAGIGYSADGAYQEWTFSGRNRRLADTTGTIPYTIYARLKKTGGRTGYLVFVKKIQHGNDWIDAYSSLTNDTVDGYSVLYTDGGSEVRVTSPDYYYVRLGDVSVSENGQRTVTLDTGILGTDQFNDEWALNPDLLPLRIELGCTINNKDAGPTPYVYWGQLLVLAATLTEGWTGADIQRFDHWEITRDSGDSVADDLWNHPTGAGSFRTLGSDGRITLSHVRGDEDDFNGAVAATFTVKAIGRPESSDSSSSSSSGSPELVVLRTATINIHAETVEKYELALSTNIVGYNPRTQTFDPASITVRLRATTQRGTVFELTMGQLDNAGLAVEFAAVDTDVWTPLVFSGANSDTATASLVTAIAFAAQQSLNVRLVRTTETDSSSSDSSSSGEQATIELMRYTIAFVRDGEDSREREWIFYRSAEAVTFGTGQGQTTPPAAISGGQVNPEGAATGNDTDKNQDGWVPQGWYDKMQGTNEDNPYEYGSFRDFIHENDSSSSDSSSSDSGGHWGPFSMPKIWSHFGKDGKSITKKSEAVTYQVSASGATTPASTWYNTKQAAIDAYNAANNISGSAWAQGTYMWSKIVITWSDDSTTTLYSTERNPNDGVAGQDIIVDGSTVMKYYVGNSNTTHPADNSNDWKDLSQVTQTQGMWLWSQATTYYRKADSASGSHDAGSSINYGVSYISKDGLPGRGIKTTTELYQATDSSAARQKPTSDSGWSNNPNLSDLTNKWTEAYKYLWNCEKIVYANPDGAETTEYTTPHILAIWTKDGSPGKGIDSITNYYRISSESTGITRPQTDGASPWDDEPMAPTEDEPYLWNYEKIKWLNYGSGQEYTYTDPHVTGHFGKDAPDMGENILLRTIFDRGIDFMKEAWAASLGSAVGAGYWDDISIDGTHAVEGRSSAKIDATSQPSGDVTKYRELVQNVKGKLEAGTWYTLSFWACANQAWKTYIYNSESSSVIDREVSMIADGVEVVGYMNGVVEWGSSTGMVKHTLMFKTKSSLFTEDIKIIFRAFGGGYVCLCMPKLERGENGTTYIPHEDDQEGEQGTSITGANVWYALTQSGTTVPADSAFTLDSFPTTLNSGYYVWEATKVTFSSGDPVFTGKMCLGPTTDFLAGTEVYAISTSNSTAPADNQFGTTYNKTQGYYLWTATRVQYTNGTYAYLNKKCVGYWGEDGTSPYQLQLSQESALINCDESGNVLPGQSYEVCRLIIFQGANYKFSDFNILILPIGISCNGNSSSFSLSEETKASADSSGYYSMAPSAITADAAQIRIQATLKADSNFVLTAAYKINKNKAGVTGKTGPSYYPAGEFNTSTNNAFSRTDAACPVVLHTDNNTSKYYYLKQSSNLRDGVRIPPTGNLYSSDYWGLCDNFQVVFIKALFAAFASLGSFIVNKDWFISQYGTLVGPSPNEPITINSSNVGTLYKISGSTISTGSGGQVAYTYFDDEDPQCETTPASGHMKFVPKLAIDAKSGKIYGSDVEFSNGKFSGEIHASSGNFGKISIVGDKIVSDGGQFEIDSHGNAKFSGKLDAASGIFNGGLRHPYKWSGSIETYNNVKTITLPDFSCLEIDDNATYVIPAPDADSYNGLVVDLVNLYWGSAHTATIRINGPLIRAHDGYKLADSSSTYDISLPMGKHLYLVCMARPGTYGDAQWLWVNSLDSFSEQLNYLIGKKSDLEYYLDHNYTIRNLIRWWEQNN